jgi:hypothetical protein
MRGCWRLLCQARRTGCLQIGDRRTHAARVLVEKSHAAIAFVAEEAADHAGRVTVIHAKGARGLLFADGAGAVLLCQQSVVALRRNPKVILETKPTLSFAVLRIGLVPMALAGEDPSLIGLVIDATPFKHFRAIFRIFCVSGLINYDHYGRLQIVRAIFSSERPPT